MSKISNRAQKVSFQEALEMLSNSKDFALIHEDKPIRSAIGDQWSIFGVIRGQHSSFKYAFPVAKQTEYAGAFSKQ